MKTILGNFSPELSATLENCGKHKTYKDSQEVFAEGAPATFLPIVISGAVKMIRTNVDRDSFIYVSGKHDGRQPSADAVQ